MTLLKPMQCVFIFLSQYSETPPYGHLDITAIFFGRLAKRPYIFL